VPADVYGSSSDAAEQWRRVFPFLVLNSSTRGPTFDSTVAAQLLHQVADDVASKLDKIRSLHGGRIPSLDGLRAISIGLVVLAHLVGTRSFPLTLTSGYLLALGELGVHVFFVISGFLITRLLLEELAGTGRISLAEFYFRRTMRIFPAYYAFLLAVFALAAFGVVKLGPRDMIHALTYTSNYYSARSWYVGHTWSLSVEEQFYLIWPAVLVLAGRRRALVFAMCVVLVAPAIRVASWELMRSSGDGIGHRFETVADAIAIGCVLAGSRDWLHGRTQYRRILASPWFAVVPCFAVAGVLLDDHPIAHFLIGMSVTNLALMATIDWCVTFGTGRMGRILNWRPMVFVGTLSYSLYLWQQLFLNRLADGPMSSFPVNIVLAGALALASYYLVERPALRLRRRLEGRWRQTRLAPIGASERRQTDEEHVLPEGAL
jgi:peptidoglycan/LPS O-acetylase OafA/YrhL